MLKMSEIDHLFDVRNNYYLGAFQQCINDAQNARVKSDADKMSRDAFLYRSYIALGKTSIPLNEINQSTASTALKAVRRFAEYIADPKKRSKIASEVAEEVNGNIDPEDTNLLMIANILIRQNNIDDALRALHLSESLECRAATIQCLLKLDRVDLAIREWKKMQEINEDATITQLALAWVNMAAGKEKLQEAFYIYQEMIDKYGATPYLQVSQASSLIQQGKYSEAEKLLLDAQQRDANDPDIIINLLTVSQFLGKAPEVSNRFINQLTEEYSDHPWVVDYLNKEKLFERLVESSTA
uniref:Coatomer subunit epsilon n=1 Tax=Panagrolaimus sp. PS1159 TaxID=55785 RepID=A0AC35G467_9BILA